MSQQTEQVPEAVDQPEQDLIYASHSSLTAYRNCPQAWMYGHIRRLEKADTEEAAVERDFGSWWHMLRAAEAFERGRRLDSLQWTPERLTCVDGGPTLTLVSDEVSVKAVLELAAGWWARLSPLTQQSYIERLGEALPDRLFHLFARWQDEFGEEIRNEQPLAVEMRWERVLPPMPGPDGPVDPRCVLVGYIDEVLFDKRRNMIVVRDDKASKTLGAQSTADDMHDSQLQFYAWGGSPIISSWGLGKVRATSYDRARMVLPTTPVLTQAGNLSKAVTDYDLHTYLTWCQGGPTYPGRKKDGSDGGTYVAEERVIEQLSTPAARSKWFQRTLTPLNANLIRAHLRAAVDSAVESRVARARVELTGEAPRKLSRMCRWCEYAELCRAEMFGGSTGQFDLTDYRLQRKKPRQR